MRNRDKETAERYSKDQVKKAHDTALKAYIEANGLVTNKVLARKAKVPASWVSKWEKNENWRQFLPGYEPGDRMSLSDGAKRSARERGPDLTEQEWKFCYSYYKTRNVTQAALNAGYSTGNAEHGHRLLKREDIQEALDLIGDEVCHEIHLETCDIINMWAKIAFADMTDYVKISSAGVFLKPSAQIDGHVIQEIKEGRDGVTIKLADRMKALDRLSEYLGVTPEDKTKMYKQILAERASKGEGEDDGFTIQIVGV